MGTSRERRLESPPLRATLRCKSKNSHSFQLFCPPHIQICSHSYAGITIRLRLTVETSGFLVNPRAYSSELPFATQDLIILPKTQRRDVTTAMQYCICPHGLVWYAHHDGSTDLRRQPSYSVKEVCPVCSAWARASFSPLRAWRQTPHCSLSKETHQSAVR